MLRTNARITPLQAVLRYRDLLQVEDLFRRAKAVLRTRPIYHPKFSSWLVATWAGSGAL